MDSLLPSTKNNTLPPRKRHQSYTTTTVDNTEITVQSLPLIPLPRKRHELYTQSEELKRHLMPPPPPPPRKPHPSYTRINDDNNDISQQHSSPNSCSTHNSTLQPSTPSTKYNHRLLPPHKCHRSYAPEDNNNDISLQSTPPRKRQRSYITPKDDNNHITLTPPCKRRLLFNPKDDNNDITFQSVAFNYYDTASQTISTWRKFYETNILKGFIEYYIENGTFPTDTAIDVQKFYNFWIERRGVNAHERVFSNKMLELSERFFMNQQRIFSGQNIQGWPDRFDIQIYRLSCLIWGKEVNDQKDSSSKSKEAKEYHIFL